MIVLLGIGYCMDNIDKKRRDLIKLSAIGAVAGVIMPKSVLAMDRKKELLQLQPPLLGNLIYSADYQGRWEGKKDSHLPQIEVNGGVLRAKTNHTMAGYGHYIIKHAMFDENFQFIEEKMFIPDDDEAVSEHNIKGHKNRVYILSVCNIHDSWLNSIEL